MTGPLAARLAALYRVLLTGCDVRLEEHRDVDHEPDTGSGHHAEKYSAHRADFFVHLFPPRSKCRALRPGPQAAIRKKREKWAPNSVFAWCQVVKLSQRGNGACGVQTGSGPASGSASAVCAGLATFVARLLAAQFHGIGTDP